MINLSFVLTVVGALFALIGISYFKGKSNAKKKIQAEKLKKTVQTMQEADKTRDTVSSDSNIDSLVDQL